MQCSEGPFPVRSASVTAGKTTLQNFGRRIESGPAAPQKPRKYAKNPNLGLAQDAPRQLGLEAERLFFGDLVQLDCALEVCAHAVHPG